MKKLLWISVLCMLCGLLLFSALTDLGRVHANTPPLQPVQVQNSGFTDSQGTITVTAACPQNYQVQSGNAQITPSSQGQTPSYAISANGPDTQNKTWSTTVENKVAGSMSITITVTCAQKA